MYYNCAYTHINIQVYCICTYLYPYIDRHSRRPPSTGPRYGSSSCAAVGCELNLGFRAEVLEWGLGLSTLLLRRHYNNCKYKRCTKYNKVKKKNNNDKNREEQGKPVFDSCLCLRRYA